MPVIKEIHGEDEECMFLGSYPKNERPPWTLSDEDEDDDVQFIGEFPRKPQHGSGEGGTNEGKRVHNEKKDEQPGQMGNEGNNGGGEGGGDNGGGGGGGGERHRRLSLFVLLAIVYEEK